TEDVERRVAHAVLKLADEATSPGGTTIDFPLSRQDIAEMTATKLHTVSRIVSAWEAAGVIEGGRQRIAIRDRSRLQIIADGQEPRAPPAAVQITSRTVLCRASDCPRCKDEDACSDEAGDQIAE